MSLSAVAARYAKSMSAGLTKTGKLFADNSHAKTDGSVTERLRKWISETNFSSQVLMENLAKARTLNEKVIKQLQDRAKYEECGDGEAAHACEDEVLFAGRATVAALRAFEEQIAENIQEDQRIIVVDSGGLCWGWWWIMFTKF